MSRPGDRYARMTRAAIMHEVHNRSQLPGKVHKHGIQSRELRITNGLISGIQFKQRSQHSEDIPCSLHFCRTKRLQAHVEDYNQSAARRTRINSGRQLRNFQEITEHSAALRTTLIYWFFWR